MIGRFVSGVWLGLTLALGAAPIATKAMDVSELYEEWRTVPPDESGLVVLINGDVQGRNFSFADVKGTPLDTVKWSSELPVLLQFRVPPGSYSIHLPGPVEAVTLAPPAGKLTYLNIGRFEVDGEPGVQLASWTGEPTSDLKPLFTELYKTGQERALVATPVSFPGNAIYLTVDPPFEIPPEPQPKPGPSPEQQ